MRVWRHHAQTTGLSVWGGGSNGATMYHIHDLSIQLPLGTKDQHHDLLTARVREQARSVPVPPSPSLLPSMNWNPLSSTPHFWPRVGEDRAPAIFRKQKVTGVDLHPSQGAASLRVFRAPGWSYPQGRPLQSCLFLLAELSLKATHASQIYFSGEKKVSNTLRGL